MEIGIVLPAYKIPNDSIVTRKAGIVRYIINSNLTIFGEFNQKIEHQGIRFLIKQGENTSISAIPENKSLIWLTTEKDYCNFLNDRFKIPIEV